MCGSTNKLLIKLNALEIKFDIGDLFSNEKNLHDKNSTKWFEGHYSWESIIIKTNNYK